MTQINTDLHTAEHPKQKHRGSGHINQSPDSVSDIGTAFSEDVIFEFISMVLGRLDRGELGWDREPFPRESKGNRICKSPEADRNVLCLKSREQSQGGLKGRVHMK
jgi:hypothetical protein